MPLYRFVQTFPQPLKEPLINPIEQPLTTRKLLSLLNRTPRLRD